jgi:hypothetical protein
MIEKLEIATIIIAFGAVICAAIYAIQSPIPGITH